jgi:RsiW-degrading membrane proteinase PrsW (M82 family)
LGVLLTICIPLALFGFLYYRAERAFSAARHFSWKNSFRYRTADAPDTSLYHSKPFSGVSLIPPFLGGFLIALPALVLLLTLKPFIKPFLLWILLVAGIEEVAKAAIPLVISRERGIVSIQKTIFLFAASSLGFALFENILYVFREPSISLFRGCTSVPLHVAVSLVFGFSYGYSRLYYRSRTIPGYLGAVFFHGIYNLGWENSLFPGISILTLGAALILAGLLVKKAKQLETFRNNY